jgi:hypothetical protein
LVAPSDDNIFSSCSALSVRGTPVSRKAAGVGGATGSIIVFNAVSGEENNQCGNTPAWRYIISGQVDTIQFGSHQIKFITNAGNAFFVQKCIKYVSFIVYI